MSDIEECHGDRDLACTEGDEHPEEQDLPRDNNEAIVVGAVGSGTPWFFDWLGRGD